MITHNPAMRLFNGHYKMDHQSLKKTFLMQLNSVYCVKQYMLNNLPQMAETASFPDLRNAIYENLALIRVQIMRMDDIYSVMGEAYSAQQCIGIRVLSMEAYVNSNAPGMTGLETDLNMLTYLRTIESIEINCFQILNTIATSLPRPDVSDMLKQNLLIAINCKNLYELISNEYLHG